MRRLIAVLLFLVLAQDSGTLYAQYMFAPLGWVGDILLYTLPIKVRVFELVMAGVLIWASSSRDGRGPLAMPMKRALQVSTTAILFSFVYGVFLRGGDARAASWQVYFILSGLLASFTFGAVFRTPAQFLMLTKAVIAAALYRAVMCWIFYLGWIHTLSVTPPPEFLTEHDDTVVWVGAIVSIVARLVLDKKAPRARSVLMIAVMMGAIVFNQRRLAWVSLVMAVAVMIGILWSDPRMKRRFVRASAILGPVLVLYVAVGWGESGRIFKPLQSFATVGTQEDASTKARNVENLGLIATADTGRILGTGYGHKYIPVSMKYSIDGLFELWQYVPHNSLLGLLAFTGVVGFTGYWLSFPTAMFFNARVARLGQTPEERLPGLVGAAQLVICANQCFGDMGLFSMQTLILLGLSYGVALRLPATVGAWQDRKRTAPAATPAVVPAEGAPAWRS